MNAVLASCPSCGGAVVVGDRFCERCGTEFADRVAASANDVGLPNPNPSARSAGHTPETTERSAARPSCVRCQGPVDADDYCIECGLKQPAARDHMELDLGTAAFVCDRGRRHARNEDSANAKLLVASLISTTPTRSTIAAEARN